MDQTKYILRPETVESVFVLYRVTGDEKYREIGWKIFEALNKQCRTPSAYSGLKNVNHKAEQVKPTARLQHLPPDPTNWNDSMESFFLAETLKYLYLLFSPTDVIPLDRYVFNTEAHPLGIIVKHE